MINFNHSHKEWKRRAKENKWFIVALVISFALGGVIL